ncbi:2-keto-3-deoxy-galactonokinase [Roseivivax halodurans JCM 10272]|uniref:2-keto-3-deoxy-galactonokinase n=1 Tax=Roseivivax halodurans JCM 10272 TaxID=1449350 RepID=X7EKA1_9RHOB|nr:2-dehydro-3-deoxygalactonokinase [Roseivivax halodurans]ETX15601.1 2-keto-3-deoxy-galactonokinase [Roseivivax halodurans JCM 10272]
MTEPDWIAVDWGTSNQRAWLMDGTGRVIDRRASDRGMNTLARADFEGALLDLVGDALPAMRETPVIVCGMAGSQQGWAEAPYRKAPCAPPGLAEATRAPTTDPRITVRILPGIRQDRPADVMRGEETQIKGFLAAHPSFDGVICLPGTHTKWVQISAGEVVSFRTFMSGELYALIAGQSVLRHTLADGWDDKAFDAAVSEAISNPAMTAATLFSLRAEALLHELPGASARARLSGTLIGLELGGARPYWLGQPIMLAGEGGLATAYAAALKAQGAEVTPLAVEDLTLAGLAAAHAELKGGTS